MDGLNLIILVCSGLGLTAVFTSLIAFRAGVPLLLIYLGIGLLAGPGGLALKLPIDAHGAVLLSSGALAVILFDSGYHTSLASYRQASLPAITLATLGVVATSIVVALFARWILPLSWPQALLLGTVLSSTDAAAVFFLLRTGGITIRDRVRSLLEVESGTNDPVAILLSLTLIGFAGETSGDGLLQAIAGQWGSLLLHLCREVGIGVLLGLGGGLAIILVANRVRLESSLYPIAVMGLALLIYSLSNAIGGSGFLSAYIAGLVAGNAQLNPSGAIRRFQDGVIWLAQMGMFGCLGYLASPGDLLSLAVPGIALALALTFVARPLAVFLCLAPFGLGWRERLFVAWVGLRGAVSILLALLPVMGGVAIGSTFFQLSFVVVLVSLVLQGWTVKPLARWLGLIVPGRYGPVHRMEVDLPGIADRELVAYVLQADCAVARGASLPRWAKPLLLWRKGTVRAAPRRFQPGDRLYFLASPAQVPLLDKLFAKGIAQSEVDVTLTGDFTVGADITVGALCEAYGIGLGVSDRDLTLAALFKRECRSDIEIGDRVHFGPVDLIVDEILDGEIVSVGIALDPSEMPKAGWERLLARVKGRFAAILNGA